VNRFGRYVSRSRVPVGCLLTSIKEHGVEVAIQAIYRDLEYAKTLIKANASSSKGSAVSALEEDEFGNIEESWTFIGDDSDPDLKRRIQDFNVAREPRVSVTRRGMSVVEAGEPVERKGSTSRR